MVVGVLLRPSVSHYKWERPDMLQNWKCLNLQKMIMNPKRETWNPLNSKDCMTQINKTINSNPKWEASQFPKLKRSDVAEKEKYINSKDWITQSFFKRVLLYIIAYWLTLQIDVKSTFWKGQLDYMLQPNGYHEKGNGRKLTSKPSRCHHSLIRVIKCLRGPTSS